MRVVDLGPEHEREFLACLEEDTPEAAEAGDLRARWYARMRGEGLRAKLALDDAGRARGMIQYLPIERAPALGEGLYFVLCVWVRGRPMSRESFQGRGMGSALLAAAEADARALGAKGMAAWGLALPFWMRARWFRRHGYRRADRRGLSVLLWKPLVPEARPPRWLPETGKRPERLAGKVVVTACASGWCMGQNLALERARRAAARYGERVELRVIDTCDRAALLEWGECDALFVDGKRVRTGPPPPERKLAGLIGRRVARLERAAGAH